jgi:hypothetical protein
MHSDKNRPTHRCSNSCLRNDLLVKRIVGRVWGIRTAASERKLEVARFILIAGYINIVFHTGCSIKLDRRGIVIAGNVDVVAAYTNQI